MESIGNLIMLKTASKDAVDTHLKSAQQHLNFQQNLVPLLVSSFYLGSE